jgi:hypothetical protein
VWIGRRLVAATAQKPANNIGQMRLATFVLLSKSIVGAQTIAMMRSRRGHRAARCVPAAQ